ncbi:MAG: DUF4314 domain-containing protein [Paludibacteraceae bacterium]|nr:DUF4314 domain-containing protein [Paludibacteraceae bacterium]
MNKVDIIKARFLKGTRIELFEMNDLYAPVLEGTKGTVEFVDDMGQIAMKWDNGRTLALIPDVDKFKVIESAKINAKTLLHKARELMNPEEIATYESSGSDLFLKVTPVSTALVEQYNWKCNVEKFIDAIDHELWYEIPWGNTDWWETRGCPCGELQV